MQISIWSRSWISLKVITTGTHYTSVCETAKYGEYTCISKHSESIKILRVSARQLWPCNSRARLLQRSLCRGAEDGYRQAATSAQCCRPCGQRHMEVRSRSDVTRSPRRASLAGCVREGQLQTGRYDVPLSSRSGTSVPRRPSHHILQRRFSASSAFRKLTSAHRNSLSTQHIWPSGIFDCVFDCWSDGLELAALRAQRSSMWFWQF